MYLSAMPGKTGSGPVGWLLRWPPRGSTYGGTTVSQQTIRSGTNPGGGAAVSAQLIGSGLAPDLGQEIVRLIEAETTYRANAALLRTASELSRDTLDALA